MALTGNARRWLDGALEGLAFPDSWLSGRFARMRFDGWRVHARARLSELLGPVPARVPFNTEILLCQDRGSYKATLLRFDVDATFRTEAYLLVPHGPGPFPGILALHDHGAFYLWGKEKLAVSPDSEHPALVEHTERHYGGKFVADELAQRGYAVMVIDQWLWGKQRVPDVPGASALDTGDLEGVRAYHALVPDFERQVAFAMIFAGQSIPGHMLYADQRALDLFLADPRIDPARVGCIGLSVGGFRSVHLAGMDDRIRAAVEIGWMCALATYLRQHDHLYRWPNVMGLCAPGLARYLDFPDVACMACPKPFLLMAGRQDTLYPIAGVEEAFAKIRAVYEDQGAEQCVETRWYDVPHCFNVEMQAYAFDWLDRWLKGCT
jgi:dienelactone hydrolase